jgi:hypothetical protein
MVGLFSKKHSRHIDRVEAKFQTVVDLVKDLDRKEFNRLKEGMELCWQGYQKVSQAKTNEEKENADIDEAEKVLEKENGGN